MVVLHRFFRWILLLLLIFLSLAAAGWPVFVRPQIDPLHRADAIFVLDGYGPERMKYGFNLLTEGWASNIVVSNPRGEWLSEQCARPSYNYALYCVTPDPPTTKGEAQELRKLAEKHGWQTVIVVTFRPHISRARFILKQCFSGNLIMAESPSRMPAARWAFEYVYQTLGFIRALLNPWCNDNW